MSEQLSCDPISFDKSFNIHKGRTVAKFSYGEQILKKKEPTNQRKRQGINQRSLSTVMGAICKNPVVKQEMEGRSFPGSVSVLQLPWQPQL